MPRFESVAPVLPVKDVAAALARYATLGFETRPYESGADYGYARRDEVWIHVSSAPHHDSRTTDVSVYFYVDDADDLYAEWSVTGVGGRHHPPQDTDYGLREAAYVDPDGNLHRYGSWLTRPDVVRTPES